MLKLNIALKSAEVALLLGMKPATQEANSIFKGLLPHSSAKLISAPHLFAGMAACCSDSPENKSSLLFDMFDTAGKKTLDKTALAVLLLTASKGVEILTARQALAFKSSAIDNVMERAFKQLTGSLQDDGKDVRPCTRASFAKWIGALSEAAFERTQEVARQAPLLGWVAALQQMWMSICEEGELQLTPNDPFGPTGRRVASHKIRKGTNKKRRELEQARMDDQKVASQLAVAKAQGNKNRRGKKKKKRGRARKGKSRSRSPSKLGKVKAAPNDGAVEQPPKECSWVKRWRKEVGINLRHHFKPELKSVARTKQHVEAKDTGPEDALMLLEKDMGATAGATHMRPVAETEAATEEHESNTPVLRPENADATYKSLCKLEQHEPQQQPERLVTVLYDFTPQHHDDLSLKTGDKVAVLKDRGDGWAIASCNGVVGLCPLNYLGQEPEVAEAPHAIAQDTVIALHDFNARNGDELSFRKGDTITVVSSDSPDGWRKGSLNGVQGLFPINYTE